MLEAGGDAGAGWEMVPSDGGATASTTEGASTIITVGNGYEMDDEDDDDYDDLDRITLDDVKITSSHISSPLLCLWIILNRDLPC